LPEWEYLDIKDRRDRLIQQLLLVTASLVIFEAACSIFIFLIHPVYAFVGVFGGAITIWAMVPRVNAFLQLNSRLDEYLRTKPKAPPPDLDHDMVVNWWAMHKDGFDSTPCRETVAPQLGLSAQPHRILRKHGLAIPAFLYGGDHEGVRRQDRARIAAYCRILESVQHSHAPYGIILKSGSYQAIAVPNDDRAKRILDRELAKARELIQASREGRPDPEPPENLTKCETCPIGRPIPYDPRQPPHVRNGQPLRMTPCKDKRGRLCHSLCGDRFEWTPPHQYTQSDGYV
jgi:hypothetical protein